jgi:ankyrin repeat protein
LLDCGANVNVVNTQSFITHASSALGIAADRGDEPFVRMLLDYGAHPLLKDYHYPESLFRACANGNETMVRMLLDATTSADDVKSASVKALHAVGKLGLVKIVRMLLEKGADVHAWADHESLLYAATKTGNEAVVRLLVERGADPQAKGCSSGETAMEKALETYDTMLIKAIMGPGAE